MYQLTAISGRAKKSKKDEINESIVLRALFLSLINCFFVLHYSSFSPYVYFLLKVCRVRFTEMPSFFFQRRHAKRRSGRQDQEVKLMPSCLSTRKLLQRPKWSFTDCLICPEAFWRLVLKSIPKNMHENAMFCGCFIA